jgi:hypothetical protein
VKKSLTTAGWIIGLALFVGGIWTNHGPAIGDIPGIGWIFDTAKAPPDCVVVEESLNRPQWVAAIYGSTELFDAAKGCKSFRWIDQNETGKSIADVQWALDLAKKGKLPLVCFRWGMKTSTAPLPATPVATADLLKKNGAK